jgi:hypothetical protein
MPFERKRNIVTWLALLGLVLRRGLGYGQIFGGTGRSEGRKIEGENNFQIDKKYYRKSEIRTKNGAAKLNCSPPLYMK